MGVKMFSCLVLTLSILLKNKDINFLQYFEKNLIFRLRKRVNTD